ncbi:hypothetical protein K469DRAFT_699702 [Zopfia rhizophila CBS 207.26]|uniref:Microbial-type PARG catalytic domain-containing protein n=1 Tax=Zopfia rhizophila CBS 207.26 TaxID=1314779 RepID=A0A6A6EHG2_9PEZI|nr:hypothetical protein K469DRAFT_699702 [Zopfia rhizophila CBS 207.26]
MGRTEHSQGLAPPPVRKDFRAKQARYIVNKVIPAIIARNSKARRGVEESELIVDPGPAKSGSATGKDGPDDEVQYIKRKGQGKRKVKGGDEVVIRAGQEKEKGKGKRRSRKDSLKEEISTLSLGSTGESQKDQGLAKSITIRIVATDTLTAAHMLTFPPDQTRQKQKGKQNVCILNMASPLRPGGGVLSGATSQEEFLCARTTLLPSLKESYYRLPEIGGVFTKDVLVFRGSGPLGSSDEEFGPRERYWIDVVSAGMLRFPELEGDENEEKRLNRKDREMVERKMKAVMRICCSKGVKKLVLGAWGCGAYGNPVGEVARAWRKVLCENSGGEVGNKGKGNARDVENWDGIEEIVFAIAIQKMANNFARFFRRGLTVETGPQEAADEEEEEEEEDRAAEELKAKIREMEGQIAKVWNPDLKARMVVILEGLRSQLKGKEGSTEQEENANEEPGDGGEDMEDEEDDSEEEESEDDGGCKLGADEMLG